jgi:hypothetical protein
MSVLIDNVGLLTIEPFIAVEIPVNGQIYQWLIRPLDGRAMEHPGESTTFTTSQR